MKTLIFLLLVITMCLSCTKEPDEFIDPKNVTITFDYVFPKTGNIKGTSAYLTFYHQYIASKILTPRTYYVSLYEPDAHIGTQISGIWEKKTLFVVPPGRYIVTGISWPTKFGVCGDTAYLKFNDTIDITQTSTNIILNAEYDCSLVLLDTTEVFSTKLWADTINFAWSFIRSYKDAIKTTMMKTEEFYHTFLFNGTLNGDGYDQIDLYLGVTTTRMEMIYPGPSTPSYDPGPPYLEHIFLTFPLWIYQMQAGKYYYFEQTANGYILPPMTEGK